MAGGAGRGSTVGFDDVSMLPVAALPGAILELEEERRRIDVRIAALLARLEATGFTQIDSGHVTATWMSNAMQRPRSVCVQRVKAATAMVGTFSRLGAAIEAGDFTLEHLEAVLRVANHRVMDALIDGQEQLLAIAQNTTFTEFERHLRSLVHLLDQDGPFDPNDEREASRLIIRHTPDGIRINGELVGTLAATVSQALNTIADRKFRERVDAEPIGSRSQLLAEALVEVCRSRTAPADGPVVEMTVVVTENNSDNSDGGVAAETVDAIPVEGAALDLVACDPIIRVMTVDRDGQPLNVGRARRLATDTQRRAARVRDGGCVFPGCDAPVGWTDLHHIDHWRNGGATDLDNLVCLCRRHHGTVHSTGWTMARQRDGTFDFTSPTGRRLRSKPVRHKPPPAIAA